MHLLLSRATPTVFQSQQEFNLIGTKGTALWPVNKQYAILNPVSSNPLSLLCLCDHNYFYSPEKDTAATDGHSKIYLAFKQLLPCM